MTTIIYPNPVYTALTVLVANEYVYQVQLTDMQNNIICTLPVMDNKAVINTRNISPGVYQLHIFGENTACQKVIINQIPER